MVKISLAAARKNANLTQKEAGERLGVSNSTICKWESGESYPDAEQIAKICELYGMSYDCINFLSKNPIKTDLR